MSKLIRLVALAALVALATTLATVSAGAKVLNGCAVLAQEELETIFEQPFSKGAMQQGDYCAFDKPSRADIPDIIVEVLVTRSKSVAKAKQVFDREATTGGELAGSVTDVDAVGDEAFSTFLIGTDELTVRVGKVVGRFRVHEPESDSTFGEQIIAVGQAAALRLENYSKAG